MSNESQIFVKQDQGRALLRSGVALGTLVFIIFVFFATMISVGMVLKRFGSIGQADAYIAVLTGIAVAFALTGVVGVQIRRELHVLGTPKLEISPTVKGVVVAMIVLGMILIPAFRMIFDDESPWYEVVKILLACCILGSLWNSMNRQNKGTVALSGLHQRR